jgi:hypothetical protein
MAEKRKEEKRQEVDGWTTSGYGIILNGKPVTPVQEEKKEADVEEIDEV